MPALLFGSIGTLAETSWLQREAYNEAFAEAGLDWHWGEEEYKRMLTDSGGRDRLRDHAEAQGQDVDVKKIHARKTEIFHRKLGRGLSPRDGVIETMAAARDRGWQIGFVTTTSPGNVDAILGALDMDRAAFDIVTDRDAGLPDKPAPDIYAFALSQLGVDAGEAMAVEDNPDGVRAAQGAGLSCLVFPGAYHDPATFPEGIATLHRLDLPA